MYVFIY
jgi:hypothetical protein